MTATQIDVSPLYLNDVIFATATSSFEKAISSVAFTPSTKTVTFQGGTPSATYSFPGPTSWTCDLTYAQDWDTAGSLSQFLHDNAGTSVPVTFTPASGGGSWAATIVIAPGAVGGNIGDVSTAKVSLGVSGTPAFTPAV
jgi:hypothetical protein